MYAKSTNNRGSNHSQIKSHYSNFQEYNDNYRLDAYKEQINQVLKLKPTSVLEIGIGNKTVYSGLRKDGINIIGMDIERMLKPEVISNITTLPFKNDSFEIILCAEVLEHLPFEDSMKVLKELKRVTKKFIILTLPQLSLDDRFFRKLKHNPYTPYGDHYWELGSGACNLNSIRHIFEKENLILIDCFGLNVFRLYKFDWLTEVLYNILPKSRLLKFNGYPIFFVLEKM